MDNSASVKEAFFTILKNQAIKNAISENEKGTVSQVFSVAEKDLLNLFYNQGYLPTVYAYITENGIKISENNYKKLQKEFLKEVYKSDLINAEIKEISSVFNDNGLEHIFFKGADIAKYYESNTDRISSDIDVLVNEKEFDKAKFVLTEKLKCRFISSTDYDASFSTANGINIELHHKLERFAEDCFLSEVAFDTKLNVEGYRYSLSNEMCLAYLIYHAAGHFLTGGSGIKYILDLYLINKKAELNGGIFNGYLKKLNLEKFYSYSVKLGKVWFDNDVKDDFLQMMEDYLLGGGKFGKITNQVAVGEAQSGGKFKYKLKRVFMPYKELRIVYPSLKKAPVLLPFYEIKRWCKVIKEGRLKNAKSERKASKNMDERSKNNVKNLLSELGINKIK